MRWLYLRTIVISIATVALVSACSHSRNAPVMQSRGSMAGKSHSASVPDYYTVQRGDTLFSIAWRFDMDYRKVAAANGLSYPYLIHPGDRIRLAEAHYRVKSSSKSAKAELPAGKASDTVSGKRAVKKSQTPKSTWHSTASGNEAWIWPVSGKIERYYSADGLSKGIDIAGKMGTPIKAVRSGQVVYAGSRLKGYGQLIIVRHSSEYLSAYAHNRKMLVKEGQKVKQGDVIAELGATGAQSPLLHFEIRRNGKPVNPLNLLPKQK